MSFKISFKRIRCSMLISTAVIFLSALTSHVQCNSQSQKLSNEIGGTGVSSLPVSSASSGSSNSGSSGSNVIPTSSSNSGNSHYRDYGTSYYYPGQKHIVWNRDSYADAASEFGYNPAAQQQGHQHQGSHHGGSQSFVSTSEYGAPEGNSYDEEGGGIGGGLGGLGGLAGLVGLAGVKGIKGLGLLGLLKAGLPLFGLLLPGLLLLPLILFFLPVPVITIPTSPTGRQIAGGFRFGDMTAKVTQLARSILDSEKCVERMSCEISRVSRGSFLDRTLKKVIAKFETSLPKPLQRMAKAYMDQSSYCNKKYSCYLVDDNTPTKKSS